MMNKNKNGTERLSIRSKPTLNHKYGAVSTNEHVKITNNMNQSSTDHISIVVIVLCVVVGDMARGILFPTLWLLVQSLGGSPFNQGMAVSAFSFGRILSSPIFGYASELYGYRYVLMCCNLVLCIGALLYTLSESLGWLIFSQIVIGIGAGSLGVTRAFVAETTSREERTKYIAYLTAAQYGGFTLTPLVGAMLSAWAASAAGGLGTEEEVVVVVAGVQIDQYSLPALFLAGSSLMVIALLSVVFTDVNRTATSPTTTTAAAAATAPQGESLTPDCLLMDEGVELSLLRGNSLVRSGSTPTSGSSSSNNGSANTSTSSNTLYGATLSAGSQGAGAAGEDRRTELLSNRTVCGCRLFDLMAVAGCLMNVVTKGTIGVFEAMGVTYVTRHYHWSSLQSGLTFSFCGAVGVVALLSFSLLLRYVDDVDLVYVGMIIMILSCLLLGSFTLPLPLFYLSIGLMYSVGYPVGHTALIGIFSKLTKSGPQGGLMGFFGSAGSLARVVFPLLAGTLTVLFGDKVIFMVVAVMLTGACAIYGYFRGVIKTIVNE